MDFDLLQFVLDNLEAAGAIGGYVSMAIIGVALATYFSKDSITSAKSLGPKWAQPIIGALFGIIPGCGGTIVASSMYKNRKLTFGGLLATFTATLGEGSFVLLGASDEADTVANLKAFVLVSIVGLIVGMIVGYVVDGFGITVKPSSKLNKNQNKKEHTHKSADPLKSLFLDKIGYNIILGLSLFLFPGSVMALWGGGIEALDEITVYVCIGFTLISIFYYLLHRTVHNDHCCDDKESVKSTLLHAVSDITLVIFFVFIGLFVANYLIDVVVGPERFDEWMTSSGVIVVIIAALIGATPGCGGMIAVAVAITSIENFPIAALIAASIATSGDGIFPLLAQNRKDAIVITFAGLGVALLSGFIALAF